jgi:hypothetical protein
MRMNSRKHLPSVIQTFLELSLRPWKDSLAVHLFSKGDEPFRQGPSGLAYWSPFNGKAFGPWGVFFVVPLILLFFFLEHLPRIKDELYGQLDHPHLPVAVLYAVANKSQ